MWVKIEQCTQELNSFKEIIEKAVNGQAKTALKPYSYGCNTNQHCFQGS